MLYEDRWVAEYSERDDCEMDGLGLKLVGVCGGCEMKEPSPAACTCLALLLALLASKTVLEGIE